MIMPKISFMIITNNNSRNKMGLFTSACQVYLPRLKDRLHCSQGDRGHSSFTQPNRRPSDNVLYETIIKKTNKAVCECFC